MGRTSNSIHWNYFKKDTIGEINFFIGKIINSVYETVTTMISKLKFLFGGGYDWSRAKSSWFAKSVSFSV